MEPFELLKLVLISHIRVCCFQMSNGVVNIILHSSTVEEVQA